MKYNTKNIAIAIVALLCLGCHRSENSKASDIVFSEKSAPQKAFDKSKDSKVALGLKPEVNTSSIAAKPAEIDTERKVVRTADLKFKVKNVYDATMAIENITAQQKGFVTASNLNSVKDKVDNTALSLDSTLETIYYTTTNIITLRVPNLNLDSTLKDIAKQVDYLDCRIITADDKSLQYMRNGFATNRNVQSAERLITAASRTKNKLEDIESTESTITDNIEKSEEANLNNLDILDKVKYSTVNLNIYQHQEIARTILPNYKNIDGYQPGFFSSMYSSLKTGWVIIEAIIVSLVKLWAFFLMAFLGYCMYKKYYLKKVKIVDEVEI